ncbi:ATP-binding protein [Kordiimonas sp.]|uniref:ATP-binding protein n=1 Tax=Kordiimonas sp. TaxID=1970157 RepID=UPI003A945694
MTTFGLDSKIPEFNRSALEALRQPLESGEVAVARVQAHVTYPARFQLIAAMNPCRCGYLDDAGLACARAPRCALDYQSKISGPLYDRIDLHVDVPAVAASDLSLPAPRESSVDVAARVSAARALQKARFKVLGAPAHMRLNAHADGKVLEEIAALDAAGRSLMERAADRMRLSARGYHRVLRVARTLADLEGLEHINTGHIAEALTYRRLSPALAMSAAG